MVGRRVMKLPYIPIALLLVAVAANAQTFEFSLSVDADGPERDTEIAALAEQILRDFEDDGSVRYLVFTSWLQAVSGRYAESAETITRLRERIETEESLAASERWLPNELYAEAMALSQRSEKRFAEVYRDLLTGLVREMDDVTANRVLYWFGADMAAARTDLQGRLEAAASLERLPEDLALDVVRAYAFWKTYDATLPISEQLAIEEEDRRYQVEDDILIRTEDGATLSAVVARSRRSARPQSAALYFTIYSDTAANRRQAIEAAARGYAGVVVDARGKRLSPDAITPYEFEVKDTYAAVDWISHQPWNDGNVGMYGGSYSGFTAWAATKRLHPALKTIVPYVAAIPGFGLPMENNVFINANYAWIFLVTNNKTLDLETYNQYERWNTLPENWYRSGQSYREIDAIDGTPNPFLQRWLDHPAYDEYWQAMVPYGEDFEAIDIPVLSITGYYDDGQISAMRYVLEHYRHKPDAEHYLLIGPYDHFGAQSSTKPSMLRGYHVDPVAQFDTVEITFKWFDHVMHDAPRPSLIQDKMNFQVMGTNAWAHAESPSGISDDELKLFLSGEIENSHRLLSDSPDSENRSFEQTVNFADRTTSSHNYYPSQIVREDLELTSGLSFISEPLDAPVSMAGSFSGQLMASINKRDMDITVVLYEVMPDGRAMQLSYYTGRASFAADMTRRQLLEPGEWQPIDLERTRMVAKRLERGSRLLVVIDVNKAPFAQINYGTGKDVSEESIADADVPLQVKWRSDSFISVPVR